MAGLVLGTGVTLEAVAREDAEEMFALVDANRERLRRWLPWVDLTPSVAEIEAFIERSVSEMGRGEGVVFVIRRDGSQRGVVSLSRDALHRRGEIGYWLADGEEGRGTMSGAVERLVRHGFESMGLNRIMIRAATDNLRSRAVAERLGFRHEGTLREDTRVAGRFVDDAVYALLRSEWAPR